MFLEVDSQLSLFALSSYSQLPSHTTVLVGHLSKCWLQPVSSEHSVVVMLNHVQIHLYPGWTTLSCSTSQNCPVFPTLCPFSSSSLPHRRTHGLIEHIPPVTPWHLYLPEPLLFDGNWSSQPSFLQSQTSQDTSFFLLFCQLSNIIPSSHDSLWLLPEFHSHSITASMSFMYCLPLLKP